MKILLEHFIGKVYLLIKAPQEALEVKNTCQCRRLGFNPWVWKLPWSRRKWHPIPIFLPGKFHRQRSLAGYSPWGHKELDTMQN